MARLATLRIHPAIAVGVSAIAALVGWVAYQELLNPRAEPQIAAATAPTPSSPVPRPVVAPTPAPPTAAPLPAAKPLPPGDEPLYAGRPLTWWNERLVLLAGQQGDEARRLHALTVRRAESLGLRARTDGGTVVLDRPAEAEAR